jgi:transglutaminase-like putative cysteine protease
VLTDFDGLTWRRSRGQPYREPQTELLGAVIRQQITLEPSNRRWWFALESVRASPRRDVYMTTDRQLVSLEPLSQAVSYEVQSHLHSRPVSELSPLGRRVATRLPDARNPRTRAFAATLRERYPDDREYVAAMLEHFRREGFQYSLEPPRTSIDSVDDFLFDNKLGFCGHFASAFATVMRSGGVPARVVTGYLGGEWNPIGGYFIVRHSDAHAWTEVWLAGRGWVRVDPTGVVAPERLDRGLIDVLPNAVSAPNRLLHGTPWLTRLVLAWDGVNHWWRKRVLEFDLRQQLALLERLGLGDAGWRGLGMLLAAGLVVWLLVIAFSLRHLFVRSKPDRIGKLFGEFCSAGAKIAPARAAAEAPLAYAIRLTVARPDLAARIRAVTERYTALRYGSNAQQPADTAVSARALRTAVRDFARAI